MERDERRVVERLTTRAGELQLAARKGEGETHYELVFNGVFLMATYNAPSCRVLMDVVLEGVATRRNMDLLIGGLGMGFALRQALTYPGVRTVCVIELEPQIVAWNRTYLGNGEILDDPRTRVVVGDFCDYVHGNPRSYHGIAIDIDNGPDWVVRGENRRAYSLSMLGILRTRLRSGGVLGVWSHTLSQPYKKALREVFGGVELREACDYDPSGRPLESVIYVVRA
jgi:spermidine synthase